MRSFKMQAMKMNMNSTSRKLPLKKLSCKNSFNEGNDHTINIEGKNDQIDKLSKEFVH